ncbi:CDC6-like ATPase [Theileria orientalis]|uniref:CDC6-like ATPase n=1 Tax=Theileria orientalis TaxID=68886 RepID=A0A976M8R8_THEOR|nr:CDC6-like ATPase [Theileria orientalis]
MCDSSADSSNLTPLEKHIKDKKLAIDLLKVSDNTYMGHRDSELSKINEFVKGCVESNSGGSMFVFGMSGTGKTTTVEHALSRCLKKKNKIGTINMRGSTFISLKAFKTAFFKNVLKFKPSMISRMLNVSSHGRIQNYAKFTDILVENFKTPKHLRICLIDEVDYLSTFISNLKGYDKSNWLLQALFKAASSEGSRVAIIAISNNLEFATKIKSANCQRLLFKPYNENQMVNIVLEKIKALDGCDSEVLNRTSLLLLARRVANTSGDCRAYQDSFIRALSNSLSNLERDTLSSLDTTSGPDSLTASDLTSSPFSRTTSLKSLENSSSLDSSDCFTNDDLNKNDKDGYGSNQVTVGITTGANTSVNGPENLSHNDYAHDVDMTKTPIRDLRAINLNNYNVGNKEIGIVTPTLSLNKREQLKNQLSGLPIFQLLLLLAVCKSSLVLDEMVILPNDAKRYFLELAEILKMDSTEAENFCNSEFENSMENFRQLSLIARNEMVFKTDPKNLAKIVLDCSLIDLEYEDVCDPNLSLTKRYSSLTKTLSFINSNKRAKRRLWWCK